MSLPTRVVGRDSVACGPPPRDPSSVPWIRFVLTLALRCIASPLLAADLLRVAWRFRSRTWYTRFPFLPLPAWDYVHWRMHTAYGDHRAAPSAEDVIRYARWVRHTA